MWLDNTQPQLQNSPMYIPAYVSRDTSFFGRQIISKCIYENITLIKAVCESMITTKYMTEVNIVSKHKANVQLNL